MIMMTHEVVTNMIHFDLTASSTAL